MATYRSFEMGTAHIFAITNIVLFICRVNTDSDHPLHVTTNAALVNLRLKHEWIRDELPFPTKLSGQDMRLCGDTVTKNCSACSSSNKRCPVD